MRHLVQDLRYGLRSLLKTPGWTALAVLALGLGIGANSAIFSIINAILIRPLPYENPQSVVVVWGNNRDKGLRAVPFPALDYEDIARQNEVFEQMGAYRAQSVELTAREVPERIESAAVSPSIFELLGSRAAVGRMFASSEDQPGSNGVVVLSDGLWRRLFNGDPRVLGSALRLDDRSYTVIGIAPPDFHLPDSLSELWVPYTPDPSDLAPSKRGYRLLTVIARLKSGVTTQQADVDMRAITGRIAQANPDTNAGFSANVTPLREQMVGDIRPTLWTLMGAVGFVLLISCANVANLLLARAGDREKEMAIRVSLGANPGRIVRQLLTESVLLAMIGGCLGLMLAFWASSALVKLAPANLARAQEISLDWRVVAFTLLVSVATGVAFGLAPAFTTAKIDLNSALRASGKGSTGTHGRSNARDLLVAWEVASCTVLLIGAGLTLRSLNRLQQVNPGFRVDHVLTMQISPPPRRYPGLKIALFYKQILDRAEELPGVQAAGFCASLPLGGRDPSANFQVEGSPALGGADQPRAKFRAASADYFAALGIPLLRGRLFNRLDSERTPKVVLINQVAARLYWPNDNPVGKRILSGLEESAWSTIIGMVGNVKHAGLDTETSPEMYYHYLQIPPEAMNVVEPSMALVIRTSVDPAAMVSSVRSELQQLDPDQPVFNIRTMQQVVQGSVAQPRYRALLLSVFASLALLLAAIGLYGVIARSVTQRTNEVGIRIALGASRSDILNLIVGRTMRLAVGGMLAGLSLALLGAKAISRLLFDISARDPITLGTAGLVMLGVALAASLLPAWRVTRTDPATALKAE
jgi:putative ABC transport system permease protein